MKKDRISGLGTLYRVLRQAQRVNIKRQKTFSTVRRRIFPKEAIKIESSKKIGSKYKDAPFLYWSSLNV